MNQPLSFIFALALGAVAATVAPAGALPAATASTGALPDTATKADPQTIYELYADRTQEWPDGSGGWYFAPNMKLAAVANDNTYGYGTWWVTRNGRLCTQVTWQWGRKRADSNTETTCWRHAVVDGEIWKQYDTGWWPFDGRKLEGSQFVRGHPLYDDMMAVRSKIIRQ